MGKKDNLTEKEKEALHELQLGKENIRKAYGQLLEFHHNIGRGMNHIKQAADLFREAGRDEQAEKVGSVVPMNIMEDFWSWKLTDRFEDGLLKDVLDVDSEVRENLANGERHINEKQMEKERKEDYWD